MPRWRRRCRGLPDRLGHRRPLSRRQLLPRRDRRLPRPSSVPCGFHLGLPLGISFFGRAWSEPVLLRLAYAFERASQARRPPRLLADHPPCLRRRDRPLAHPLPAGEPKTPSATCCSATASARVLNGGFQYGSLKDKAQEAGMIGEEVGRLFAQLGTSDFEQVLYAWSKRGWSTPPTASTASRSKRATRPRGRR